ncbi:MAG: SUMF1/EgtB/PvdO family nonheme iron enzyme [Planctomycetes bacterium]|nr:SUMF1/EgtB/PvdO family nonheme iron enzyme [Planctomycetota bacterium]
MPMQQELPEQFGRYRIVKKLGAGGMGAVYLAEDAKLRRKVALKVPHFTAGTRGAGLERFQREARLAAGIDHPNFCPVHDVDEVDGIHFFTMTYLEGTPLADLIADEQPWPVPQAVDLVRRVALAVGELHSRGIVHRDLKPANIMVRPSGEPVLMDFGLACSLTSQSERLTGTGEVLGTLAYMPPEQLEGDRARMGPAADVYSLGMILYELLTGQLPFSGPPLLVVAQVGGKVPEPPSTLWPGLDARLDAICLKALAKKPEERFPDTAAFVAALEAFLGAPGSGRVVTTMPQPRPGPLSFRQETVPPSGQETATRPPRPPAVGRRGLLVLVLLMVVGTALWLGMHFWPPRDAGTPDPKPSVPEVSLKKGEPSPPKAASFSLGKLGPVRIKAGQRATVTVTIQRENFSGPVQVAAKPSENVFVRGQVGEGKQNGEVELVVTADAKGGDRVLLLQAFALGAGVSHAETELVLTILPPDMPPPSSKPSLRLEEIAEVRIEAGKKAMVPVKVKRDRCPGPVQVELADALSEGRAGVMVSNGLVRDGSDAGSLVLEVGADAKPGERKLRLRAVAGAAEAAGELKLTIQPAPPKPSLRLLDIVAGTVEAGQTKTVVVKIKRQRCPGSVEVKLAKPLAGVKVLKGQVGTDTEEGSLELEVASDAEPGERTLHLQASSEDVTADGELKLTIQSAELAKKFTNTLKMEMVRIKSGTFKMGSPEDDKDKFGDEVAQHPVKITRDFYMGATEVTVSQFNQFVEEEKYKTEAETDGKGGWGYDEEAKKFEQKSIYNWKNPGFKQDDKHPVVNVTWNDAMAFCKWLSKKEKKYYDLPTEAEWEYACRAGTTTRFHNGDDLESLTKVGNVADASFKAKYPAATWALEGDDGYPFTAPVKKFRPNDWGLYDMHGNAWEWCKAPPRKYPTKAEVENLKGDIEDPVSPENDDRRVLRGGSWCHSPRYCRSANRVYYTRARRSFSFGFRVVLRPGEGAR